MLSAFIATPAPRPITAATLAATHANFIFVVMIRSPLLGPALAGSEPSLLVMA
jgi:hypothetical protein